VREGGAYEDKLAFFLAARDVLVSAAAIDFIVDRIFW
jgi:hypothetical protein